MTSTPLAEAAPIPLKKLIGIDITRAQGQDTTKNSNALYIHVLNVASAITSGGIIASATAGKTTTGV